MMNDKIHIVTDTLPQAVSVVKNEESAFSYIWLWILLGLLFFSIVTLIIRKKTSRKMSMPDRDLLLKQVKNDSPVDFANIMNSAFLSSDLYDILKVKCHPDRFINSPEKLAIANDLFQRITQNKANYKILLQLKQEAKDKLNITF